MIYNIIFVRQEQIKNLKKFIKASFCYMLIMFYIQLIIIFNANRTDTIINNIKFLIENCVIKDLVT